LEQTMSILPVSGKIDILEVGCGAGFSAEYLRGRYNRYLGIDGVAPISTGHLSSGNKL